MILGMHEVVDRVLSRTSYAINVVRILHYRIYLFKSHEKKNILGPVVQS